MMLDDPERERAALLSPRLLIPLAHHLGILATSSLRHGAPFRWRWYTGFEATPCVSVTTLLRVIGPLTSLDRSASLARADTVTSTVIPSKLAQKQRRR